MTTISPIVPYPHQFSIPDSTKLPIDGTWKSTGGLSIFRIEKGKMYIHSDPNPLKLVGGVIVKDIQRVNSRTYKCNASAVNNINNHVFFGPGEIQVTSNSHILLRTFPNTEAELQQITEEAFEKVILDDETLFQASLEPNSISQDLLPQTGMVVPATLPVLSSPNQSGDITQVTTAQTNTIVPIEILPPKPQITTSAVLEISMGQRVALVIGNSDYKELPLQNPVNDANDMAQVLRNLKFEVAEIKNGSKREMLEAMNTFEKRLQKATVGLFYYSGHGMQYQGNNYLIPIKAEIKAPADLEQETIDARRILGRMEDSPTELNIVVLDACRDNPFSNLSKFRSYGNNRGLSVSPRVRGALIAYSTQPDNVAADGTGRNSPYTKHLLRYLKQQLHLSVTELFNEVGRSVWKETNGAQEPWISASPMPHFCFGRCL